MKLKVYVRVGSGKSVVINTSRTPVDGPLETLSVQVPIDVELVGVLAASLITPENLKASLP